MKKQPFHFVTANPASESERRRESQLARSHTARVNRGKRAPVRPTGQLAVSLPPKKLALRPSTTPSPSSESARQTPVKAEDDEDKDEEQRRSSASSSASDSSSSSSSVRRAHPDEKTLAIVSASRSIATPLSVHIASRFAGISSDVEARRTANYCVEVIWPHLLMDEDVAAVWFTSFQEQLIIFHAFHYASMVHHDIRCNKISWSQTRGALRHKTDTIRLLNHTLSHLTDDNIHWAILTVLVLATNEPLQEDVEADPRTLFRPHIPEANWTAVYARMKQHPEHGKALFMLIEKAGGLERIKLPALAGLLAFSDVLAASYALTKPHFPCYWTEELSSLLWPDGHLFLPDAPVAGNGRGFAEKVPSGLPPETAMIMASLTIVDQAMDQGARMGLRDKELLKVINIRNRAHHSLLSIPAWKELGESEQALYDEMAYECCRWTTLLYGNEIIFPIPPNSIWPVKLLEHLACLLKPCTIESWSRESPSFLLWILVIAGIASFRTPQRAFFEKSLRRTLEICAFAVPKEAVKVAVMEFLWTESACGSGFVELWESVVGEEVKMEVL